MECTEEFIKEIARQVDKETIHTSPNIYERCKTPQGRNSMIEWVANYAIDHNLTPAECITDIEMILNGD